MMDEIDLDDFTDDERAEIEALKARLAAELAEKEELCERLQRQVSEHSVGFAVQNALLAAGVAPGLCGLAAKMLRDLHKFEVDRLEPSPIVVVDHPRAGGMAVETVVGNFLASGDGKAFKALPGPQWRH